MTQNRRIVLNVVATYGRTMFSIVCGLFTVRWVLMVLGQEGFGLFGVVGSMAIFVGFLNGQLSDALARFYAVSIGRLRAGGCRDVELENCRAWFSCGIAIHICIPMILLAVGYPIGEYGIVRGWLTIPEDRVNTCIWLWRFACISSFVAMVNSPFSAMYIAKQYIAELTVYSFAQTVSKTAFVYLMTIIPGDWLFGYGMGMCLIAVVPQALICCRAFYVFEECKLRRRALFDVSRIRQIVLFAWWKMFGGIGYIARHQCLEVIVNRQFGPKANAAYTVASTFGAEAATLTGALNGAFAPVIASAFGEGRIEYMKMMALRSSKFGSLLTLAFAVPMFLEVDEVLRLWLKDPPAGATSLCMIMLLVVVVEKLTLGHYMAISSFGDIRGHMVWRGGVCMLAIPLSLLAIMFVPSVASVSVALLVTTIFMAGVDVYYAKIKVSISVSLWVRKVLTPIALVAIVSGLCGCLSLVLFPKSFLRVCITTFLSLSSFAVVVWLFVLEAEEKAVILKRVRQMSARLGW